MKALTVIFSVIGASVFMALTIAESGDERMIMAVVATLFYMSAMYAMTMEEVDM